VAAPSLEREAPVTDFSLEPSLSRSSDAAVSRRPLPARDRASGGGARGRPLARERGLQRSLPTASTPPR
jgi:hypothetical protein